MDLIEALKLTLELANDNVIDHQESDPDLVDERIRQLTALAMVDDLIATLERTVSY